MPDRAVFATDHHRAHVAGCWRITTSSRRTSCRISIKRPPQAERDSDFALQWVKQHARTPEQQQAVVDTLAFKCDVLWCMLDALHYSYVTPGLIPPGAFVPKAADA